MVTSGVSTRKVEKVARALGVDRMSASLVSRICESTPRRTRWPVSAAPMAVTTAQLETRPPSRHLR